MKKPGAGMPPPANLAEGLCREGVEAFLVSYFTFEMVLSSRYAFQSEKSLSFGGNSEALEPKLKQIGGSQSDGWNLTLANQAINSFWPARSDKEFLERQKHATLAVIVGIRPNDELEGMIAAQLLAAHNAAMECYRRAMIPEQS